MGTINYNTSDYITLGVKPYDADSFKRDSDFMAFIRDEWSIDTNNEAAVSEAIYGTITDYYDADAENVETALNKYSFYYYHIEIKPGYYEGFSLDIEPNFPLAFESWEEKREAQKEITEIKAFLKECAGLGLVACYPGWCMHYEDYKGTLKEIDKAIKGMREDTNATPTWRQYERESA